MKPMPSEISGPAEEADNMLGEEIVAVIPRPSRPYRGRAVIALAEALGALGEAFGMEMAMPGNMPTGEVPELPPEIARTLAMVTDAATSYGSPPPVALEEIQDDTALTAITSWLQGLAADEEFAAWLGGEEEMEMEDEPSVEEEPDEKALFADRMR